MSKLFVEQSIHIDAPVSAVWRVLTAPECTREWSPPFGARGPIDSDWKPGADVLWRNAEGRVYVSGRVIAVEPEKLLKFSVRSASADKQPTSGPGGDDITQTYALSRDGSATVLSIAHGDFRLLPNRDEVLPVASAIWDDVLLRIKALAER